MQKSMNVSAVRVALLRQEPGQGDFAGGGALALSDVRERVDDGLVGWSASGANRGLVLRMSLLASKLVYAERG